MTNAKDETICKVVDFVRDHLEWSPRKIANELGYKSTDTIRRYLNEAGEMELWDKLKEDRSFQQHKVEIETEKNSALVTSESTRVKTLEDLIEEAEIDLDTWEIERYDENKWDAQKTGGEIVEMYKVEAKLTKRVVDEKEFEPVRPLTIESSFKEPSKPIDKKLKNAVIIPDVHLGYRRDSYTQKMTPFHDRRCLDLALQLIDYVEPDLIIQLGDFLDVPEWSKKFTRSPEFTRITQASGNEGLWWLQQMRQLAPNAEIVWLEGNHCERLPRYLKKSHKAAYGLKPAQSVKEDSDLVSIERFMKLNEINVNYVDSYPDNSYWINDNLVAEHGDRISSVNGKSAGQILDEVRASHLFGHVHRLEMATKTTYPKKGPVPYQSITLGCLCRLGGNTPGTKQKQDWQNALATVDFEEGNGIFYIQPIFIHDGNMIYDGQLFEGKTRLEDIKEEAKVKQYNFVPA